MVQCLIMTREEANMKRLTVMSFSAAIAFAGAMQARAALKYEPDSYAAQDALVL